MAAGSCTGPGHRIQRNVIRDKLEKQGLKKQTGFSLSVFFPKRAAPYKDRNHLQHRTS